MIANPAIPFPGDVPHPFTLNDLRVHDTIKEEPSPTSKLTLYGMGLAMALAIGTFIWLDPLHLFTPTEASPPAPSFIPSAGLARPAERLEIIAPPTPVPATKSVEVPVVPAPAVQSPAASTKPGSRGIPMLKTTAPPALLNKPEEKSDTPIVPKVGDDPTNAPQPAPTIDQAPVTE